MKKRDFLLIIAILLFSAVLYLVFGQASDGVSVYKDGELLGKYSLSEDRTVDIGGTNTLVIEKGEAYMQSANCPDKLCIKQGKIGENGGSIVCLPNKVIVENRKNSDTMSR